MVIFDDASGSATWNQGRYLLDRGIQFQFALLDQLHDCQCREAFGDRADIKLRLGCDRFPGRGFAIAFGKNDLVALHDGNCQTGNPIGFDLRLEK